MLDMSIPEVQKTYQALATALSRDGVNVLTAHDGSFYLVERETTLLVLKPHADDEEAAQELARRIADLSCTTWHSDGTAYVFWSMDEMVVALNAFSDYPALTPWIGWLCREVLPAMRKHGYYNPATGHEPPASKLLDALECTEAGRDVMRGMGLDWVN